MGICKTCGGAIFASNEVVGYNGPVCPGNHASGVNQSPITSEGTPIPSVSYYRGVNNKVEELDKQLQYVRKPERLKILNDFVTQQCIEAQISELEWALSRLNTYGKETDSDALKRATNEIDDNIKERLEALRSKK